MKNLILKHPPTSAILISLGLFAIGFMNISFAYIPILAPYSLALCGALAFFLSYGLDSFKLLFSKPASPIKNFLFFFVIILIMNFTLSYVVINILQLGLEGNPLSGHIPWLQLPFMLLGEELLSFYILLISASLLINTKHSLLWSNLISALVFALLHVFTYWNGNIFLTLFHVLLLQGLSRLILNTVGLRTNAVWIPWTIHILFDIISLGLVYLA